MNRRGFVRGVAGVGAAAVVRRAVGLGWAGEAGEVRVRVRPDEVLAEIPADFMGLGYEISSVARVGLLSGGDAVYVQLVRTLGAKGVIRVGGNTADYAKYAGAKYAGARYAGASDSPAGRAVSAPNGTVVNDRVLRDLGGFLQATGWRLIWGIDLGEGSVADAVEEAQAVKAAVGERLLAIEIGNEPDLFRHEGHRKTEYGYAQWHAEYRRYREAIRAALPGQPLAGPDVAGATDWVTRFAADEQGDVSLLTHHYYREGESAASTLDKLLRPDPKLGPTLARLRSASKASGVPYRICEVNSFSGGGRPGVSDSFGAALWVLEYMFALAAAGCAGVNLETGVNQRGFVSSYSPIGDDEQGHYRATPEFYGMLAFAQSGVGRVIRCEVEAGGRNVSAYATRQADDQVRLTLLNKESVGDAEVVVEGAQGSGELKVLRLTGPSLESKTGVMLGGAEVGAGGAWRAVRVERVTPERERLRVRVPAGSAAIVGWVGEDAG